MCGKRNGQILGDDWYSGCHFRALEMAPDRSTKRCSNAINPSGDHIVTELVDDRRLGRRSSLKTKRDVVYFSEWNQWEEAPKDWTSSNELCVGVRLD